MIQICSFESSDASLPVFHLLFVVIEEGACFSFSTASLKQSFPRQSARPRLRKHFWYTLGLELIDSSLLFPRRSSPKMNIHDKKNQDRNTANLFWDSKHILGWSILRDPPTEHIPLYCFHLCTIHSVELFGRIFWEFLHAPRFDSIPRQVSLLAIFEFVSLHNGFDRRSIDARSEKQRQHGPSCFYDSPTGLCSRSR